MKRINFLKEEWLQILILIAPFAIMLIAWDRLPDRIPIHWNLHGHVNGYGSIFIVPVLNIGLTALFIWLSKIDPKARKMNLPNAALRPLRLVITAFLLVIFCLSIAPSLGWNIDTGSIIPNIAIPLLFLLIGNYLPALKPNYFVGVRTPWTRESPENWRMTHQFTGKLWVIASIVYFALNFMLPDDVRAISFGVYLGVLIVPPLVYSYVLFQKK